MATTKKQNIRKIQKQANGSTTIALPPEILKILKWRDKQKVVVKKRGEGILIEDWVPPKPATVKTRAGKKTTASKKKTTKKTTKKTATPKKKVTKKVVKKTATRKKKKK